MSIYIKTTATTADIFAWYDRHGLEYNKKAYSDVPDHGDLIDRTELAKVLEIEEKCDNCKHRYRAYSCDRDRDFVVACEAIYEMPVVIPADRAEQ